MSSQQRRLHLGEVRRFALDSLAQRPDRLARVRTVDDFERLARRRTPRGVFEYVSGAAEREVALARSTEVFDAATLHPHVMRDVSRVDASATVLGRPVPLPVVLGPTGFTRMMHAEGESAVARAAARAGLPYTLSTMGTTSPENLPAAGERWFQLYLWKDRGRSRALIERARLAGFTTLVLTVDVPVSGGRFRDSRNGLTIPPTLTPRTMLQMAGKPRWLFDALTTDPLTFESLAGKNESILEIINSVFEPSVTPADVEWLRGEWSGDVVVKGIQRVDDAKTAVAAGATALAVSNHGGRQLDRAATPLRLLPSVVDAVGESAEVYLDGGVRSGADVAIAVALGATACFVARPYLYALMAAGERGVDRLLELLKTDYERTLALLGVTTTAELDRDLVSLDN